MEKTPIAICWLRRDLRLNDNAALYHALKSGLPVLPLFIFDTDILSKLEDQDDARVSFIHQALRDLKSELEKMGSSLLVLHGTPQQQWAQVLQNHTVKAVFFNRDYEPAAIERDQLVSGFLTSQGVEVNTFKDHVVFEKNEVLKDDGQPYTVFTPYSRKWMAKLQSRLENGQSFYLESYPSESYFSGLFRTAPLHFPSLEQLGFVKSRLEFPSMVVTQGLIKNYGATRDFPGIEGTSKLGIHFRFGTISIREKARNAIGLSDVYLNELIWRDFYSQVLAHFPQVVEGGFKPTYSNVVWRHSDIEFERWRLGLTGYPMVDAGMRELLVTGFMHNRVRMITASFFTKHLLMDWRLGEAWFAQKLLDFDLASNNGGWQWAAGCGTDAAPYFHIFNPAEQAKKFDPEQKYIRKWVPEYGSNAYPLPMVDHKMARERYLEAMR